MSKITKLTPEQEAQIDNYVNKWIEIGLGTDRPNDEAVLKVVPDYYEHGELNPPKKVVFVQSVMAAITLTEDDLNAPRSYDLVKGKYVENSTEPSQGKERKLTDLSKKIWDARVGTSFWSGYNAWRDYMGFLGIDIHELEPTFELAKYSCYIFPFEDLLIVVDKPTVMHFDANNNLHNLYGPAIEWDDGDCMYLLNGIRMCGQEFFFDPNIPENEKIKRIQACENTEQRVCMMRYIGYDKFLESLQAELIDENPDTKDKLYTIVIEGTRCGPFLMMTCPSTGKVYFEGVGDAEKYEHIDPTIKTCEDAHLFRYKKAMNGLLKNVKGFAVSSLEYNT